MPNKDLQLDIAITGNESELAKACGLSVRDLKKLEDAVTTVNRAIGKESQAAFNQLNQGQIQAAKGFTQVSAAAEKTARQVEETDESFKRFRDTVAGVFTGEVLFQGIEAGIRLVEEGVGRMVDLFKEASMQAGEMELKVRGMGNLFRSQAFAQGLTQQLQQVAYASPFQLVDLMEAAQRLSGFGIKKEDMLQTVKDLGNIVAGTGGGRPEMNRAALAYGEAITSQTLTTREINQLTALGVPVWEALEKLTGKTNQELHKLIEKHMLSSSYITRVIEDLTHGDGLFTDAMVHFSETFIGLLTTFQDRVGTAIRDLGDFFNVFTSEFLKFIDNSPLWEALHNWFLQLKDEAQAVLSYLPTMFEHMQFMPKMEAIGEKIQGVFKKLFGGFDVNEMFTQVYMGSTGNIETVLTAKGDAWVSSLEKFLDPIINLIDQFVTFAQNPAVVASVRYLAETAIFAMQDMIVMMAEFAAYLNDIGTLLHGIVTMNPAEMGSAWKQLQTDVKKYEGAEPPKEYFRDTTPQQRSELNYSAALQKEMNDKLTGATAEQLAKDHEEVEAAKKAMDAHKKNTEAVTNSSAANALATTNFLSTITQQRAEMNYSAAQQKEMNDKLTGATAEQLAKDHEEVEAAKKAMDAAKKNTEAVTNSTAANVLAATNLLTLTTAASSAAVALQQLSASPMTNFLMGGGLSDATDPTGGLAVREEYDWEGHSSQYGPLGNRLQTGPYVGLNPQEQQKYHAKIGDYVLTEAGWLKVQESASRPGTIEFHANRPGQFQDKWSHLHILGTRPGGSASINLNYSPTIHHTGDAHQMAGILHDHAEHIASIVSDVYRSEWERTAAV